MRRLTEILEPCYLSSRFISNLDDRKKHSNEYSIAYNEIERKSVEFRVEAQK